ncbi:MAG: SIR2 family protein [Chloroflexota bacterium]|nr:SIR2 family protein [Chloroflexota bacterium]MDE2895559.1 SIR2 family protein [Chloroflexota bacterium]
MRDLNPPLKARVQQLLDLEYADHDTLKQLVNTIIDDDTDYEHVITFLDNAPSLIHRQFADNLRQIFEEVLRQRLLEVRQDLDRNPIDLYTALFDFHKVENNREHLKGILTTNYDSYVEEALQAAHFESVYMGFDLGLPNPTPSQESITVLKLHGSFDWQDTWPIEVGSGEPPLWIPPGIQKDKQRYPFNAIWAIAREVLACDILRIIGCRLDGNDWDLISLLFSTIHVQSSYRPYQVEIIDSPQNAKVMAETLPYLQPHSMLEIDEIGRQLVSEWGGGAPQDFSTLNSEKQAQLITHAGSSHNWFEVWLRQKAELLYSDLGSLDTTAGAIRAFLEQ